MDSAARKAILNLLGVHRLMTVATLRADGWPQATTVGYVSDGLTLHFICAANSQKAVNIARDDRISLTIDSDTDDPFAIKGLSMAARATPVSDAVEIGKVLDRLGEKYPEYKKLPGTDMSLTTVMRVTPEVISILDYSKGFGHSDLVSVGKEDLRQPA